MRRVLALLLLLVMPGAARGQAAVWDLPAATRLLAAIDNAATHGLAPERYGRTALADAVAQGEAVSVNALAEQGFNRLAADLMAGAAPQAARRAWHVPRPVVSAAAVASVRDQALATGDVAAGLERLAPQHPDYAALRRALVAQQAAQGPIRDAILASLERWRWMPRALGQRHLWVNVPAFEARLIDGGTPAGVHRVIVGKRSTPTPQFTSTVGGVILNPEWIVPASIQAEGIGRMVATNPAAAAAKGYRKTATGITQAPGPNNQLGQMKLRMPNPFTVYLHDTPAKALFNRKERALSHGCIRTEDPFRLAQQLLAGTPGWDRAAIDAAVRAGKTVDVPLADPIPVHIVYFTAEADAAGGVRIHPDIYGRDGPILAALRPGD
jgi:murein L,D-transpeptidase YcbB/YkuD